MTYDIDETTDACHSISLHVQRSIALTAHNWQKMKRSIPDMSLP